MLEGSSMSPTPMPLTGFIGPSGKDGHVRIYRDLTFRSYYEVPSDAVDYAASDDPEAPTEVFVAPGTPVAVVEATTGSVEAGFVTGSISQGRLGAAAETPGANPPMCITLWTAYPSWCPPTTGTAVAAVAMDVPGANPPMCITLWTAYPSWCPPTTTTGTAVHAGGPPICITLDTAYPSWCEPGCYNTGVPTRCG